MTLRSGVPIVRSMLTRDRLFTLAAAATLCGCAVGLDRHPLTPEQSNALRPRPAPTQVEATTGLTTALVKIPIAAPPDAVWARLAVRYGDVHEWSSAIEESDFERGAVEGGQGAARSCKLGPNAPIGKGESFEETILAWDPARRYFVAGVDDGFYPMKRVVQEFWVDAAPDGATIVTSQFHYDLAFPMGSGKRLLRRLKPQLVTSLLGLKHVVETGDSAKAQDAEFLRSTYPEVLEHNGVGS